MTAAIELTGTGQTEEETRRYVRSPADLLRMVAFLVVAAVVLAMTLFLQDALLGFEEDLIELFTFLTPASVRVMQGVVELVTVLLSLAIFAVPLLTKRYRLFGYILAASLLASASMSGLAWLVDREGSTILVNRLAQHSGVSTSLTSIGLGQLVAMLIAVGPFVSRTWRKAGAFLLAGILLTQLLVTVRLPAELILTVPVGAACGAAVLLAFGRPDRRPTEAAIAAALVAAGIPVSEVHPASVDARGSTPYFATHEDGSKLFVKVLGAEERAADLLFRVYRFLRLKDVGDDRPFSSLRRAVEHEALVALMARDIGVRTPRLRGVVGVGSDSMLLAYDMIDGTSLDSVADEDITPELMRAIWDQIALMRRHRFAHRDLRRANVFVAETNEPWIIDFGFSEVAESDQILNADVAQMLASFSVVAGAEPTVSAAVESLGAKVVADSLPRLQKNALSGATQTALKERSGLLAELQQEVMSQCNVENIEFAELERMNRSRVIMVVALVAATYFLLPQLADLPAIGREIRGANWAWAPAILLASVVTYVAAAMALAGAVPSRVKAGTMVVDSFASSFASKLAPAGVGGMALNVRFLQKQGVERAAAVSAIGLNTVAGFVGHLSLVGVFIIWAGSDAFGSFRLPDPKWFLLGAGVALVIGLISLSIGPVRRMLAARLLPVLASSFGGLSAVLRRPGKVSLLLGGSVLITFAYLTTLFLSIQAFGGGLAFATVGAVYLVGAAVAQAAPTPGGLGAMEAALIGGLVAAGLDKEVAVPAVFLFRLFTFWVPILPGWFAFQYMQRNDLI